MVLYCRARYASAPCWIALEIFCISGVPRGRASTHRARKTAKMSAMALAPMTSVNREDCVCVMLLGEGLRAESGRRSRVGWSRAFDAAPEQEHRDPDEHEHEAGDRFRPCRGRKEEQQHHRAAEHDVQRGQHGISDRTIRS